MNESTDLQILKVAQQLIQQRGYNAFSYADISEQVGIRKASIHYYFPTKGDLGQKLVAYYRKDFQEQLAQISHETDNPRLQLAGIIQLYLSSLQDQRLCLCGMLLAEYITLPEEVRSEVREFFKVTQTWIAEVIERGCKQGIFSCHGSPQVEAHTFLCTLNGMQLLARLGENDLKLLEAIGHRLLAGLVIN